MSGVFRAVATIASIVAIIPSPIQPFAAAIAVGASIGATLTQKKPPLVGALTDITIGAEQLTPYAMGRIYGRPALVHDVGWGGEVDDVPNPYRTLVFVLGGGGPYEAIEAIQANFETMSFDAGSAGMPGGEGTGRYVNFLWADSQLGECPESNALTDGGSIPGFGASAKLSGKCAFLVTMQFDKDGNRWSGGGTVPQWGAIVKGALVYDPREDDTYPGGSGACRALDEDTYLGFPSAENPGCHAVTYALGRWQGAGTPKKVFGCGFPVDGLDWPAWVDFMNVCDANAWTIGGNIFEPGSRWDNLKRICQAGGAEPCFVGGLLSVRYPRTRTALDTITAADLADGQYEIPAMKSWKGRLNGLIPKYRSEPHQWELVQSSLVTVSSYVTADGEEKQEERPYECVTDVDQAAQLAAYELTQMREIGPIVLPCKPRFISYRLGDALEVDLPEEGLSEQLCTIIGRTVDPATAIVTLTLETETTAKHAYALGETGTEPPIPSLPTNEEVDEAIAGQQNIAGFQNLPIMPDVAPVVIKADYAGTVLSGQQPRVVPVKRYRGPTDVTTSAAWSVVVTPSDAATVTVGAATGLVTIDDVEADAVVDVTSELAGVALTRRFPITLQRTDPPAASGTGEDSAFDSSINPTSSSSYGSANTATLTLTIGPSGDLNLSAPLTITPDAVTPQDTTIDARGRWRYRVVGAGSWTNGTERNSHVAASVLDEGGGLFSTTDGAITVFENLTGLTPTDVYEAELDLRNESGTRFLFYTGTASMTTD